VVVSGGFEAVIMALRRKEKKCDDDLCCNVVWDFVYPGFWLTAFMVPVIGMGGIKNFADVRVYSDL